MATPPALNGDGPNAGTPRLGQRVTLAANWFERLRSERRTLRDLDPEGAERFDRLTLALADSTDNDDAHPARLSESGERVMVPTHLAPLAGEARDRLAVLMHDVRPYRRVASGV